MIVDDGLLNNSISEDIAQVPVGIFRFRPPGLYIVLAVEPDAGPEVIVVPDEAAGTG